MVKVNVATLKAKLSKYLELVQGGEQILVTSHGREVAKIGPAQPPSLATLNWKLFFQNYPAIKPKNEGKSAAALIREIRDEE